MTISYGKEGLKVIYGNMCRFENNHLKQHRVAGRRPARKGLINLVPSGVIRKLMLGSGRTANSPGLGRGRTIARWSIELVKWLAICLES